MTETKKILTPAQQLTKNIMSRLVDKKLIDKDLCTEIEPLIAEGKMQQSDWKLIFEKSLGMHKKS